MKNLTIKFFAAFLLILTTVSCGKVMDVELVKYYLTESFVLDYYTISGINCILKHGNHIDISAKIGPAGYGFLSKDNQSVEKYKNKCIKHNDFGYNKIISYGNAIIPNQFQDRDFTEIRIVSDADFDDAHPAGSSLTDIFHFCSTSPKKFIDRGYQNPYDWDNTELTPCFKAFFSDNYFYDVIGDPVEGLVSEIEPVDMVLLGGGRFGKSICILTPVAAPTLSKTHNFTITFVDDEGGELSTSIEMNFD